jgi:hypothetical protein
VEYAGTGCGSALQVLAKTLETYREKLVALEEENGELKALNTMLKPGGGKSPRVMLRVIK